MFNVALQVQTKAEKSLDFCLGGLKSRLEETMTYIKKEREFSSNLQTFAKLRSLSDLISFVTSLEEQKKTLEEEIWKLKDNVFEKKWQTKSMEEENTRRIAKEKEEKEAKEKKAKEEDEINQLFKDDFSI